MFDSYNDAENFKEANGYTIDGIWYPRVTKIVSIKAKPALYYFYAEAANFKAGQAITQKSAAEGTLVHEAVEAILMGQTPEIDPAIAPAVAAFRHFLAESNIHVLPEHVERRIVSPDHRYAGTIDVLALLDGKFGVLDIKTSQAIYRDYDLQTAAYMDALKNEFENLQTRWILRVDQIQHCQTCNATRRIKGGREKIHPNGRKVSFDHFHAWGPVRGEIELKEFPYWQEDFEAFLGAKKLWEWENSYWLKKIGYL